MASHTIDWQQRPPDALRGGALTIGNFDGVHRGHAALIAELHDQARAVAGPAVALTFDPHPLELLRPETVQPLLTTPAERVRLLHELGADHVLILRSTHGLLGLTAEEFFNEVVQERLAARTLVEGGNFGFGRRREGNVETLARLCEHAGIRLTVVPPVLVEGGEVSSSRIRTALLRGAVGEAGVLLGRPYRLYGKVSVGQRRGQTLGFPTANLERVPTLVPGDGVYAVRVFLEPDGLAGPPPGQAGWPGAANIGPNPTFAEQERKVEVHLIGFQGDLYGRVVAVDFLERLRDTRPFGGVAELIEQLRHDVEQARQLAGRGP